MDIQILLDIVIRFVALTVPILSFVVAYLQYKLRKKEMFEKKIIQPISSSKEFYEESERIHKTFSLIRVVSKTPGLILPSERNLAPFRKEYFQTICSRLNEHGDYHLKYLFDTPNFKTIINEYKAKGEFSQIAEIKKMLSDVLNLSNLDLRTIDTEPLMGMVIGGESVAIIGFKEPALKHIAEGILVKAPEVLRVLIVQFDALFARARKIESVDFVDEILRDVIE
jgi:hypothetical protein